MLERFNTLNIENQNAALKLTKELDDLEKGKTKWWRKWKTDRIKLLKKLGKLVSQSLGNLEIKQPTLQSVIIWIPF